ncbi:cytochrome C biogenesis protein [Candidatus Uhrbacteria bacterium]|nr:cytochrome C biogenesis protein [Candidatus Uhrbacteria bacterium]
MNRAGVAIKTALVIVAFILSAITFVGVVSLLTSYQFIPSISLSLFSGISMIFLPCTFPLVFIIVPLALSKRAGKGLALALSFGLGLTLTFTIYGIATGLVGGYIGLSNAVRAMLTIGGFAALFFGISELGLVRWKLPFRNTILPQRFQQSNEYVRGFLIGFFIGNAGVGCPNPAFYVLFGYVATLGDPIVGAYLGALHGIGRVIPLLLLVTLALLGVNAAPILTKWQGKAKRAVAWVLVVLGSFILNYGIFSNTWFEESAIHKAWNLVLENIVPAIAESEALEARLALPEGVGGIGPWMAFAVIIALIILWDAAKKRQTTKKAI